MSGATDIELPETMHIEGEEPADPATPRKLSPREEMMNAIAARAHEHMLKTDVAQGEIYHADAKAAGLVYPDEEEEPPPAPEPEPEVAPEPVATVPPEPAPAPVAPPPIATPAPVAIQPTYRTVNLNGQRYQVTDEQFEQLANLGVVASLALGQQPEPPPAPVPPPKPLVDTERAREVVKQMQYGGEEAAVPALVQFVEDVISRAPRDPAPVPVDVAAIQRAATDQATTEALRRIQFAQETAIIQSEFPQIFSDPTLRQRAAVEVETIRFRDARLGLRRSDLEVYREAGFAVRDALGQPRPGSDVQPTPPAPQAAPEVAPREQVIERKRAAPRNPQAVTRRDPTPEAPRTVSGSEIVAQMRKQRGQPNYG